MANDYPKRIFLIGPMGAGKTTVGRRLAQLLDYTFMDSDQEIESRTGVDIAFIFEKEGEQGFREREQKILSELTELDGIVLSTGGGAVLDPTNQRHLTERGFVVYLETSIEEQLRRTRRSTNRPLLDATDRATRLRELMAQREQLYRALADLTISTDHRYPKAVATEIHKLFEARAHSAGEDSHSSGDDPVTS
ncbi:MAG: shikimate kinase AroK [Pseudomonadota bacterium]|nr:shikimate kinase AroK [Pseudomonadota bacterium]